MTQVALVGAGGKMGLRISSNLKESDYQMNYLEVSPAGIEKLEAMGLSVSAAGEAIPNADIVILAVPDVVLAKVANELVPMVKAGTRIMTLDPAVAHAGLLPKREDIAYFVTHPCHPSIFNWEADENRHRDYFGGQTARQAIVCAIMQGAEDDYLACETLAQKMFAPVLRAHRITVDQMALLEPAYAETMAATVLAVLREGLDEVVKRGVPKEAARDFILGHMNIELAVLFNEIPGVFSDACNKAIKRAKPIIFKDGWRQIFEPDDVHKQVQDIIT